MNSLALWALAGAVAMVQTEPPLTAHSAVILDAETGRIVWEKGADEVRFPASTTKIVTALVLLERARPEEIVTIPQEAAATKGSGIAMKKGDKFRMADLVAAILVKSANNACVAAAVHVAGSQAKFVEMMNQKAVQLGAVNTKFKNPHGLHDPEHFSSAHDLALFGRAALNDPEIVRIASLPKVWIGPIGGQAREYLPTNKLLGKDLTNFGLKTGWTNPAGRCFVGWHQGAGMRLVTVVLGCEPKWETDQATLMAWFWTHYEPRELIAAGGAAGEAAIPGALWEKVSLVAAEPLTAIVRRDLPAPRLIMNEGVAAPLARGQVVGRLEFSPGLSVPVASPVDVPSRTQAAVGGGVGAALVSAGLGLITWHRKKNR